MDNAFRHNTAGGWVSVTTGTADGRAVLSVRNTGPAVPPEEVDSLFEPFRRLDGTRLSRATDRHGARHDAGGDAGHGLGLAIVAAIARAHGAAVTARARPGGGLDVHVSFPAPA